MFKNRAAQITFVKTPKNDSPETTTSRPHLNDAEIKLIKSTAKGVGLYVLGTAVAIKVTSAICEIAINYAPKN